MADAPRLLHRRSQFGYTDRVDRALFDEPEAVSDDEQFEITERSRRHERDTLASEWGKCSSRVLGAVDHFTSVTHPPSSLRSSLRVIVRQVERIERDLAR